MRQDTDQASHDYNRCSWQWQSERCAYVARVFPGQPAKGNGMCWKHHGCTDAKLGAEIVTESRRAVRIDFDYSSAHLLELSSEAYLERPVRKRLPDTEDLLERAAIEAEGR